jgi:hypothetical protein
MLEWRQTKPEKPVPLNKELMVKIASQRSTNSGDGVSTGLDDL